MQFTHSELSELAKKVNAKLVAEGRHPFQLNRRSSEEQAEIARKIANRLVQEGNHPFTKEEVRKKAIENTTITQKKMVEEGTHHLLSGEIQRKNSLKIIEEGTHPLLGPSVNLSRLEKGTLGDIS